MTVDVALLLPLAQFDAHALAEPKDAPNIGLRTQPLPATGTHPPAMLGRGR